MSRHYFAAIMGMCDSDRYNRQPYLSSRPVTNVNNRSIRPNQQIDCTSFTSSSSSSSSRYANPDGSVYPYPYPYQHPNSMVPPFRSQNQRSLNREPRTAGYSHRDGTLYVDASEQRDFARNVNRELLHEFDRLRHFRDIIHTHSNGDGDFAIPKSAHELSMMDHRDLRELCSLYCIEYGTDRKDSMVKFLRHIGAEILARKFETDHEYFEGY